MNKRKSQLRLANIIFGGISLILFLMITCPPIVKLFDRNDIWLGPFPLSQVFIFLVPILTGVAIMFLYFFDTRIHRLAKREKEGANHE